MIKYIDKKFKWKKLDRKDAEWDVTNNCKVYTLPLKLPTSDGSTSFQTCHYPSAFNSQSYQQPISQTYPYADNYNSHFTGETVCEGSFYNSTQQVSQPLVDLLSFAGSEPVAENWDLPEDLLQLALSDYCNWDMGDPNNTSNFRMSPDESQRLEQLMNQVSMNSEHDSYAAQPDAAMASKSPSLASQMSVLSTDSAKFADFEISWGRIKPAIHADFIQLEKLKNIDNSEDHRHFLSYFGNDNSMLNSLELTVRSKSDEGRVAVSAYKKIEGCSFPGGLQVYSHSDDLTQESTLNCPSSGMLSSRLA